MRGAVRYRDLAFHNSGRLADAEPRIASPLLPPGEETYFITLATGSIASATGDAERVPEVLCDPSPLTRRDHRGAPSVTWLGGQRVAGTGGFAHSVK